MELKEMIKVMQHYENVGKIEFKLQNDNRDKWTLTCSPSWNWIDYNYRIKEPKQKVTIEKWLCQNSQGDFIVLETTDISAYYYKKVQLIDTYELEI